MMGLHTAVGSCLRDGLGEGRLEERTVGRSRGSDRRGCRRRELVAESHSHEMVEGLAERCRRPVVVERRMMIDFLVRMVVERGRRTIAAVDIAADILPVPDYSCRHRSSCCLLHEEDHIHVVLDLDDIDLALVRRAGRRIDCTAAGDIRAAVHFRLRQMARPIGEAVS